MLIVIYRPYLQDVYICWMIGKTNSHTLCTFIEIGVRSLCIFIDVDMIASCTNFHVCRHFGVLSLYIFFNFSNVSFLKRLLSRSDKSYSSPPTYILRPLSLSLPAAICKLKPLLSSYNSSFNLSIVC